MARHELTVKLVPIHVVIPVAVLAFSEKDCECLHVFLRSDNEYAVAFLKGDTRRGHYQFFGAPQTRNDELRRRRPLHITDCIVEDCRILDYKRGDKRMVGMICLALLQVAGAGEELAQNDDGENHAHHTERIGDGTTEGCCFCRKPKLHKRLLGSGKRGGIGRGSAQHACHVADAVSKSEAHRHGGERAEQNQHQSGEVHLQSALLERAEETRSHLQTEGVDKQHQSETFCIVEHLMVDRQAEVTGENAHKKHECDTERNTSHTNAAERQS